MMAWQQCNTVWLRAKRKRSWPKSKLCCDGTLILSANPYSHQRLCQLGLKWTACIWMQCINIKVEAWWVKRSAAGTRGLSTAGTQCRCCSNGSISVGQLRMAISQRVWQPMRDYSDTSKTTEATQVRAARCCHFFGHFASKSLEM